MLVPPPPPPPQPVRAAGGTYGAGPLVAIIDLDDLAELAVRGLRDGYREVLADIAGNARSAKLAQAIAASAAGGPLGFLPNAAAGFLGGQLIPGGTYTVGDYVAAAAAANAGFLRSFSLWPRTFPLFLARPVTILAGPWAVGGTVAGNIIVRQFGPAGPNDSLALTIARGLFLDGAGGTGSLLPEYGPHVILLGPAQGGAGGVLAAAFDRALVLIPFWEQDP